MCDINEVKLSSETMVVGGGHRQQKTENVLSTDSAGGGVCVCVYTKTFKISLRNAMNGKESWKNGTLISQGQFPFKRKKKSQRAISPNVQTV